jgi:hypothetical protein
MPLQAPEKLSREKELKDSKARSALLERVVASTPFKRAARLRDFLLFVGQRSLQEGCDQIHEQEIGTAVFGRPEGYDTSLDNIVRVNATELRKRIESYFESEGAHETLILEIPRGSYKPIFHQRPSKTPAIAEAPAIATDVSAPIAHEILPEAKPNRSYPLALLAAGLIILLLTIACGVLWMQNRDLRQSVFGWERTPSVGSFWTEVLNARPNTDIILADTSFALIEDITKKPIPLNDYLNRDFLDQLQSKDLSQDRRDDLSLIVARNFGSVGDFRVAQRIVTLDPLAKKIHLYYARDYRPSFIKQDNVILIGSRKSNPWVDLFESSLNFTVEYDPNRFISFVKNRAPKPGEQEVYTSPPAPNGPSGYSVAAYLPNPDQNCKVLIIAGTSSEATEAAGEFLTSEEQLARFQETLHVTKLPYFEVLLKTTHLSGTPIDASIVAYRTYPSKP